MERRRFTWEFKLEAVRLIKERGVGVRRPRAISVSIKRSCVIG
jgi:transposase-like protein